MREKITIINPNGEVEEVELITELENEDGNHYIVYTNNEIDENENIKIYASKVVIDNDKQILEEVTDEEFNDIEKFLDSMLEDN